MKKGLLALVCSIIFTLPGSAQDSIRVRKHNINAELGGTGLSYSFSYERHLGICDKFYHGVKGGISYQPFFNIDQVFVPIEYNFYLGRGRVKFLTGAGIIGLIGANPSPNGISARQDFKNLYATDPAAAISKYNTDRYEQAFDISYTAKIGVVKENKVCDVYLYYNVFYMRLVMQYHFQPFWLGAGVKFKIGR